MPTIDAITLVKIILRVLLLVVVVGAIVAALTTISGTVREVVLVRMENPRSPQGGVVGIGPGAFVTVLGGWMGSKVWGALGALGLAVVAIEGAFLSWRLFSKVL